MPRIDDSLGRQGCHNMLKAVHHLVPATFSKVRTPYTHAKQRITGEYDMLLFTIEEAGAMRMSWRQENLQRMGAEGNGIALLEQTGYRRLLTTHKLNTHELAGLLSHVLNQWGILVAHLNL